MRFLGCQPYSIGKALFWDPIRSNNRVFGVCDILPVFINVYCFGTGRLYLYHIMSQCALHHLEAVELVSSFRQHSHCRLIDQELIKDNLNAVAASADRVQIKVVTVRKGFRRICRRNVLTNS